MFSICPSLFPPGEHFWSRRTSKSIGGHGECEETAGWPWRVDRQHGSCMLIPPVNKCSLIIQTLYGILVLVIKADFIPYCGRGVELSHMNLEPFDLE